MENTFFVGDIWEGTSGCFRRITDLVDTGIDKLVYWKDECRCTGRCLEEEFRTYIRLRRAKLKERRSEKGYRIEHNERFKKCGNYALEKPGSTNKGAEGQLPATTNSAELGSPQSPQFIPATRSGPIGLTTSGQNSAEMVATRSGSSTEEASE